MAWVGVRLQKTNGKQWLLAWHQTAPTKHRVGHTAGHRNTGPLQKGFDRRRRTEEQGLGGMSFRETRTHVLVALANV